jgi:hypothetical protein
MTISYSEALQEVERLNKVTGQHFEVVPVNCDCEYSPRCGTCAGEGIFFDLDERCVALVPYDPDFHIFSWSTVANAGDIALNNDLAALRRQAAVTFSCVREATEVVRELTRVLEAA